MSDVKVNKVVLDALSEADKNYITTHLKEFGVLKAEQNFVADACTPRLRLHLISTIPRAIVIVSKPWE